MQEKLMSEFVEKYVNSFTDFGFKKLFETAEIAKFSTEQLNSYEDSLKYYRDLKNSLDTAREEGREEGIDVVFEVAGLAKEGKSKEEIAKKTDLSIGQVEQILGKLDEG